MCHVNFSDFKNKTSGPEDFQNPLYEMERPADDLGFLREYQD